MKNLGLLKTQITDGFNKFKPGLEPIQPRILPVI